MRRRQRLALVLVLGLAACGGSAATTSPSPSATPEPTEAATPTPEPTPTPDPDAALLEAIHAAVEETIDAGTVSLETNIEFQGSTAIPDGTSIAGTGSTSFGEPRQMALDADMSALGLGAMRIIVDDTLLYMTGDVVAPALEPGQWLVIDTTSDDASVLPFIALTEGQNDASLSVYYLFGATGSIAELRPEDIDGTETNHYGFDIDLDLAADTVPPSAREAFLDNIAAFRTSGVERTGEAEVWIGDDGLIYRTVYTFTLGRSAGGGTIEILYDFFDHGFPLDLGIPDEADQVRIEDLDG